MVLPLDTPPIIISVFVTLNVVKAEIKDFHGMGVLDRESLNRDTVTNRLSKCITVKGPEHEQIYNDE